MRQIVVRLPVLCRVVSSCVVLCCVSCRGSAARLSCSWEDVFFCLGLFDGDRCVRGLSPTRLCSLGSAPPRPSAAFHALTLYFRCPPPPTNITLYH